MVRGDRSLWGRRDGAKQSRRPVDVPAADLCPLSLKVHLGTSSRDTEPRPGEVHGAPVCRLRRARSRVCDGWGGHYRVVWLVVDTDGDPPAPSQDGPGARSRRVRTRRLKGVPGDGGTHVRCRLHKCS